MNHITITTEHVTDAFRAGPTGVIVHQTQRLDDWASGASRVHYQEQIDNGWLTVAADYDTLLALAADVAPGVSMWDAEWSDALAQITAALDAKVNAKVTA